MRRYVLSKPAESELIRIKAFLVQEAGDAVAFNVLKQLRQAMRFLGSRPEAGHVREDLTARPYKFWPVYSYLVVYDPAPRPIEIVRVLHGAQDLVSLLG